MTGPGRVVLERPRHTLDVAVADALHAGTRDAQAEVRALVDVLRYDLPAGVPRLSQHQVRDVQRAGDVAEKRPGRQARRHVRQGRHE